MKIIGGTASGDLAARLADQLDIKRSEMEVKHFPDGERYLRILDDVKDQDVAIVQSLYHKPDEYLFEYLLAVDTLKDLGARKVIGVIPYLAYARQDERYKSGEALSFKTVTKLIEDIGTDHLITVDAHRHRTLKTSDVLSIPYSDISATPTLAKHASHTRNLTNPLVVAPDAEAEHWAKLAAEALGSEYEVFEKKRLDAGTVEMRPRKIEIRKRDILIVDDMISTGGTMIELAKTLNRLGASRVVATCTHAILVQNALSRIQSENVEAVIGTDTVPSPVSKVSVAPLIADQLQKMFL